MINTFKCCSMCGFTDKYDSYDHKCNVISNIVFNEIYRKRQTKKMIDKIKEELIMRSCHPNRIRSYMDYEELLFIGFDRNELSL